MRLALAVLTLATAAGGCGNCWEEEELNLAGTFAHYRGGVSSLVRVSDKNRPEARALYRLARALRDVRNESDPSSLELALRSTADPTDRTGPGPEWLGITLPLPLTAGERLPITSGQIPQRWRIGPPLGARAVEVGWRVGREAMGPSMVAASGFVDVIGAAPLQLQIQLELVAGQTAPVTVSGIADFRQIRNTHEECPD